MISPHVSVLLDEVVTALAPKAGARFIDATFGAGGYSRAILEAADCTVLGIDRDPTAIARGEEISRKYDGRLTMALGCFGELDRLAEEAEFIPVDGIALDLGVSSMQLDERERGFSFMADGPLDMRMGGDAQGGRSAADIINEDDVGDIILILRKYGEERRARAIVQAIDATRKEKTITRTLELVEVIERVMGKGRPDRIHPATRTFQALRIAVNDELGELHRGLRAAERALAVDGQLAVVSFHSLEDRIVKQFFTERGGLRPQGSRHKPELPQGPAPTFHVLKKGSITPSQTELSNNSRSRSARLRCARRTDAAAWENEGELT